MHDIKIAAQNTVYTQWSNFEPHWRDVQVFLSITFNEMDVLIMNIKYNCKEYPLE